ncbi:MAG: M48 family metalloprotease [Desulfobacterales bacterium]|nr:M48 family metalloprotease [Desulfobacterales bacterium]
MRVQGVLAHEIGHVVHRHRCEPSFKIPSMKERLRRFEQ